MKFFNAIMHRIYFDVEQSRTESKRTTEAAKPKTYQTVQIGSRLGGRGVKPEGGYSILARRKK